MMPGDGVGPSATSSCPSFTPKVAENQRLEPEFPTR